MEEQEKAAEVAEDTTPETAEAQERGQEPAAKRLVARRAAIAAACAIAAATAIVGGALALAPGPEAAHPASTPSPAAVASNHQQPPQEAAASQKSEPAQASEGTGADAATDETQEEPPRATQAEDSVASNLQDVSQGPGNSSRPSDPAKQWVWVVDQPTTTQTVHHDVVMTQEPGPSYSKCTVCGADITGCETEHSKQHALDGCLVASWTAADYPPIDVVLEPAWDEVVEIPERGHWEYR